MPFQGLKGLGTWLGARRGVFAAGVGLWALGYLAEPMLSYAPEAAPIWRLLALLGPSGFVLAVLAAERPGQLLKGLLVGSLLASLKSFDLGLTTMALVVPNLPRGTALLVWSLVPAWELLPFYLLALALFGLRRSRPGAIPAVAAVGLVAMEVFYPHFLAWSWVLPLAGWPFLVKAAALVGAPGMSALLWAGGAWAALRLRALWAGQGEWAPSAAGVPRALAPVAGAVVVLAGLALGHGALPRRAVRRADFVVVQPVSWWQNAANPLLPGVLWLRVDEALEQNRLPKPGRPLLVVWPESSLRGSEFYDTPKHLEEAARKRDVALAAGLVGDALEVSANPPKLPHECRPLRSWVALVGAGVQPQGYVRADLFPWTERVPLPTQAQRDAVHDWLKTLRHEQGDRRMVFAWQGMKVAPVLCGESMEPLRMWVFGSIGIDLILNPSNGLLFGDQPSTVYQGLGASLRAVELGVPTLVAANTGPSGVMHADGNVEFWGERMTSAIWPYRMDWQPVQTPFSDARIRWGLLAVLLAGAVASLALGKAQPRT